MVVGLFLAGFIWLFKAAVGRALDKRIESLKIEGQQQTERLTAEWQAQGQQQTEQLKAVLQLEVQRDVERLKAELLVKGQHQLEQLRAELSARNEAIRHEMQKQFLRAQLATSKTHEVYAKLIELVLHTEGAIGGLWGARLVTDYSTYSIEQLEQVLKEARPGGEEQEEILAILKEEKRAGLKRIKEVLRRRELEEAKRQHTEAKNHLIHNRIFVTKRVRELADEVLRQLGSAWTAVHMATDAPGSGPWHEK
ncbi:hypothetical protein D187_010487 [Cystobacter fuscus DSM 2262]|uniref:Uncharacterized protein n=1 Tax=Cystobacter fuscus (strain ATCC 25194 / DSM 2262 / NBRC 100088 / M29) TaxID=1242864 RepID=S9QYW6_CYSF2|nr:hypothetical protein [Cystobacter fuscus]EPX61868.1 hypothetical protein D187_010487 [Cystobacter fuscus DSM 2262]